MHFGIFSLIARYLLGRKLEDEVIAQRLTTYIKGLQRTTTTKKIKVLEACLGTEFLQGTQEGREDAKNTLT